jgi:orotidine-5'-phosphate decarboxylase
MRTSEKNIMAGGWGCPHEANDICTRINHLPCDPGMKGCVLAGRYVFANENKNGRMRQKQGREETRELSPPAAPGDDNSGYHP